MFLGRAPGEEELNRKVAKDVRRDIVTFFSLIFIMEVGEINNYKIN